MFARVMRWVYIGYAWLFLAGIVTQFYLAGLAVFSRERSFESHAGFGFALGAFALLGLLLSFSGRVPWLTTGLWAILVLQIGMLQSLFASFMITMPGLAAFHVIDAVAIFSIAAFQALQALRFRPTVASATPERKSVSVK